MIKSALYTINSMGREPSSQSKGLLRALRSCIQIKSLNYHFNYSIYYHFKLSLKKRKRPNLLIQSISMYVY